MRNNIEILFIQDRNETEHEMHYTKYLIKDHVKLEFLHWLCYIANIF